MATNAPKGVGRKGTVRDRTQFQNPKSGFWTKRNAQSGRFMDVKTSSLKPFKGIKKEKTK